jgi:hypothetical protein
MYSLYWRQIGNLLFPHVFALEHVVDLGEVVGTLGDGVGVTLGDVVLLEMGLVSEIASLSTG